MNRNTLIAIVLTLFILGSAHTDEIPQSLSGWSDWVLRDAEFFECPFEMTSAYAEANNHVCAWPGRLIVNAGKNGTRFNLEWFNYTAGWIPLPGDDEHWPLDVLLNGDVAPVIAQNGGPAIWAGRGKQSISGTHKWTKRPESIRIPTMIALVDLKLDGQRIFPLQRSGDSLWLGRPETIVGEADALSVQVYRKLIDGIPAILETRLRLDVSGQGREESLGPVLPKGFTPIAISGKLPVLIENDGKIRLQLRPGNWGLTMRARALEPLSEIGILMTTATWPATEIWSFESAPQLRVTAIEGGTSVDPSQVDVPPEWAHLPCFAVSDGTMLTIEERSRGMNADANRLNLEREIWLDFRGRGMTVRDTITGEMSSGFRLDIASPFELTRAQSHGQALMVSQGGEGLTGVELRNPSVKLRASARVVSSSLKMPITGWNTSFESVYSNLNLPPGRVLIAAIGADSCRKAWIEKWSLLDVFLLLITTMLAGRLLDAKWGIFTAAVLALSYHESIGPLWCLLMLLCLTLLRRALPEGRFAKAVTVGLAFTLVVSALVLMPFVAEQLRLALYPQLEQSRVGSAPMLSSLGYDEAADFEIDDTMQNVVAQEQAIHSFSAPKAPKAQKMLQRYAASNVVQAGGGEPSWTWRSARIVWNGPVMPEQQLRLVITPSWLTRLLRIILVAILALVAGRIVVSITKDRKSINAALPGLLIIMGFALIPSPVSAQATPDLALLEELRQQLSTPPECVPNCGHIESSQVIAGTGTLTVKLNIHSGARIAVPLPSAPASWRITEIRVDGQPRSRLMRAGETMLYTPLERGVHHIEMRGTLAEVDSIAVHFPTRPSRIKVTAPGWDISGIRDHRLLTDRLNLIKIRSGNETTGFKNSSFTVDPFVRIERSFDLDLDWTVTTRVVRLAPDIASFSVELPLINAERVLTPGFEVNDGRITVSLSAGVSEIRWSSRLERSDHITLIADEMQAYSETWLVTVSPQWSAFFAGVPASYARETGDYWVHEFHPLPEETLKIDISRPEAVSGATLAIDTASLETTIGRRAREHQLNLDVRCTRGGQHSLTLPQDGEVLSVNLDGANLNIRPDNGKLIVPVHPGKQSIIVRWRDPVETGFKTQTPHIDLGSPASNLLLNLNVPPSRWIIMTSGPRIGPAVLYWGELLVMALVAFLLSKLGRSPLKLRHWMILGLGFSTFSWVALTFVVVWLLLLDARGRLDKDLKWWQFNLMQLALGGLTAIAMVCLLIAIPYGLLSTPDMHVSGNASSATSLRWFDDQTDSVMPIASALSLPMYCYRATMLAWALWLASTIVTWLRWGWSCSIHRGGWMKMLRKEKEAPKSV